MASVLHLDHASAAALLRLWFKDMDVQAGSHNTVIRYQLGLNWKVPVTGGLTDDGTRVRLRICAKARIVHRILSWKVPKKYYQLMEWPSSDVIELPISTLINVIREDAPPSWAKLLQTVTVTGLSVPGQGGSALSIEFQVKE